ncbi:MAG: hypothetical protein IJ608_06815 [Lachnospiraceae bacterium]|nr:hypothetical protein [Lachnospiraceae bacterium]
MGGETYIRIIISILGNIYIFLCGVILWNFLSHFADMRLKRRISMSLIILSYALPRMILGELWDTVGNLPAQIIKPLFYFVIAFLFSFIACALDIRLRLLIYSVFVCIIDTLGFLFIASVSILSFSLNLIIKDWLEKGYSYDELMLKMYIAQVLYLFLEYLILFIIEYFLFKRLSKIIFYPVENSGFAFLMLPVLVDGMICMMLRTTLIKYEDEMPVYLYDEYPTLPFFVPVIMRLRT